MLDSGLPSRLFEVKPVIPMRVNISMRANIEYIYIKVIDIIVTDYIDRCVIRPTQLRGIAGLA